MQMPCRRPSAGLVVAVVALVAAVTGVAVANPGAASSTVTPKKVMRLARTIANKQIAKRAPHLSVAHANTATSANPIAFAHVQANGTIDQANSKNMGNATVTNPSGGLYCFRNLPFAFKGAQITTDFDDSSNEFGPQFGSKSTSVCNPAADAYVAMVTNNGTASINGGFFIMFYD